MAYLKIEFPCGYKMSVSSFTLSFNTEWIENGCPLHGKKCKKVIWMICSICETRLLKFKSFKYKSKIICGRCQNVVRDKTKPNGTAKEDNGKGRRDIWT